MEVLFVVIIVFQFGLFWQARTNAKAIEGWSKNLAEVFDTMAEEYRVMTETFLYMNKQHPTQYRYNAHNTGNQDDYYGQ